MTPITVHVPASTPSDDFKWCTVWPATLCKLTRPSPPPLLTTFNTTPDHTETGSKKLRAFLSSYLSWPSLVFPFLTSHYAVLLARYNSWKVDHVVDIPQLSATYSTTTHHLIWKLVVWSILPSAAVAVLRTPLLYTLSLAAPEKAKIYQGQPTPISPSPLPSSIF